MGFQSTGKGGLRIVACNVENQAMLWKAPCAAKGNWAATPCRIGTSGRAVQWQPVQSKQCQTVENFYVSASNSARNEAFVEAVLI